MNDLEPTLGPEYIQLCDDNPITFISAYQYMLDVLKVLDKAQEPKQIQEIQDNIIQEYFE